MRNVIAACALAVACFGCKKDQPETTTPAASSSTPAAPTTVLLATYGANSGVTDNVRNECTLEHKVAEYIVEAAPGASVGAAGTPGRVLAVEITTVIGAGGGAWSGAKSLELTGTLTENGAPIGTFRGRRSTSGGAFGGYKGTCTLLHRDAKALGQDIAGWLAAPTMNALLGEL